MIELPTRMAGYVVDKEQRDLLRKSVHQKEFERIEVIRLGHFLEAEQLRHLPNDLRILAVEVERDPVEPVELRFLKKPFAAAAVCFENLFKSAESRSRILFLGQGDDSFECVRPKTSPGFLQSRPGISVREEILPKNEPIVHDRADFLVLEGGEEKRASLFSPQRLGALIRMRETKLLKQTDEELVGKERRERAVFFLFDGQSDQSDTVLSSPQLQHLRADPVPILARLRRVPLLEGLDAAEKQDGGVVEIRAAEISLPTPHEHFGVKATGPFGAVQHALGGTVFQQVPQPRRGQLQTLVPTVVSVPRDFQDPPFLDSFLKKLPSADAGDAQVFESVLQKARRIFSTAAQRDGEQGEHFLPGRGLGQGRFLSVLGSDHVELRITMENRHYRRVLRAIPLRARPKHGQRLPSACDSKRFVMPFSGVLR